MNQIDFLNEPLDKLNLMAGSILLGIGHNILFGVAAIMLICYLFKHGLFGGIAKFAVEFFVQLLLAATLLKYYYTPASFLDGLSFAQLFPTVCEWISQYIDQTAQDHMFLKIAEIMHTMEKPGIADWVMIPTYWIVQALFWVYQAAAFASIGLSYLAIGILVLIGPLFIPWLIVPKVNYLFWNWMQSVWQYSFYRVVAHAAAYVASTALLSFLDATFHGQYALAAFQVNLGKMIVLVAADIWFILRIGTFTSDLFKGASSAGTNFIGAVAGFRRGILH